MGNGRNGAPLTMPSRTRHYPSRLALARAFHWQEQIAAGSVPSVSALADQEGVDEAFVRRQLRLTLHPPRIIEDLANGGTRRGR